MNGENLKYSLYLEMHNSQDTEPIPNVTYNKCVMSKPVVELGVWGFSRLWLFSEVNVHFMNPVLQAHTGRSAGGS